MAACIRTFTFEKSKTIQRISIGDSRFECVDNFSQIFYPFYHNPDAIYHRHRCTRNNLRPCERQNRRNRCYRFAIFVKLKPIAAIFPRDLKEKILSRVDELPMG